MNRLPPQITRCFSLLLLLLISMLLAATNTSSKTDSNTLATVTTDKMAVQPLIQQLTAQERSWLQDHKSIRVAFDGYFPPYSFINDSGQYEGMAVDILSILSHRLGITLHHFQKPVWKDLYEAAKHGEVDVVATMGNRPERHKWFAFTRPYIFKSLVIMTRKETTDITRPADLSAKKVAVVKSYQYVKTLLTKYPAIKPLYVNTMLDGLNAVAVGQADAAITYLGAGQYLKNKYQLANLKFAAIYDRNMFTECIAVRGDWPILAAILDKTMASISVDKKKEISQRWLGPETDFGIAYRTVFTYLALIIGFFSLIITGFSYWNRSLRKQVDHKTRDLHQELLERKKVEEALLKSEELLRHYFEQANIGLALTSPQKGWLRVNHYLTGMLGYTAEELFTKTWAEMTYPEDLEADELQFNRVLAGDIDNYNLDKRFYRKDGELVFTHLTVSCTRKPDGSVNFIIATLEDISARKLAEKQLKRKNRSLYAISKCSEIVVLARDEQSLMDDVCRSIITAEGYILAWIGIAERDENKTVRTAAQAGFEDGYLETLFLTWDDSAQGRGPTGTALRTGKPAICQHIHTDPLFKPWRIEAEKRGFASSISLPMILRGNLLGALSIYADEPDAFDEEEVTMLKGMAETIALGIGSLRTRIERKKAELELQEHRDHLAKLVDERTVDLHQSQQALMNIVEDLNLKTTELQEANDKLKELDRLKSMFIASMSHELRTPLNSIIGFSGIMLQGMSGGISVEQRDQLTRIFRAGKHLLLLITDVIDIAKIESGKITPFATDFMLGEVIDEAMGQVRQQAEAKGITLNLQVDDSEILMHSDRQRLLQCLLNLLSNAVKFTEKGSVTIAVAANIGKELQARPLSGVMGQNDISAGWLEISVTDTGIGIQVEDMKLLFKSFVRLESTLKATVPGTGLGLYLTKKLVTEVLGGKIGAESEEGMGSKFWLQIPMVLERGK